MATTPLDREAILKAVEELPPPEQLQVAQQIMRHYLAAGIFPSIRSARPG